MSIRQTDTFKRLSSVQGPEQIYPSEFPFRIIAEAAAGAEAALRGALAEYCVTEPLAASQASSAGRYQAYSVTVQLRSRDEHQAFDAALKQVPGVRLVL
jgi:putative lipoic acid-binding regulatory protein